MVWAGGVWFRLLAKDDVLQRRIIDADLIDVRRQL